VTEPLRTPNVSALPPAEPEPTPALPLGCERQVEVPNPQGIHARPAMLIAKTASAFKSEVTIRHNEACVNAKSTLSVLTLVAQKGANLTVEARGEDAAEAVSAMVALVRQGFDEM